MHNYKSLAIQMAASLHEIDRLDAEFNDLILSGMPVDDCWNRLYQVKQSLANTKTEVFKLNEKEVSHAN